MDSTGSSLERTRAPAHGLEIEHEVSLRELNSFGLPAMAHSLVRVKSEGDVRRLLADPAYGTAPKLVLGGGSNLVFSRDPQAVVLRVEVAGRRLVAERPDAWIVEAGAGENWHEFVAWTLAQGWPGLENLALIPGTVGAAPVQNIGAYGVELAAFVEEVGAVDRATGERCTFTRADCRFAYRHSIFKGELAERTVITDVTFRLPLDAAVQADYPALRAALDGAADPTPAEVLRAVLAIRRQRLPDPQRLPNVGSFFHNPVLERARFESLRTRHPDVVHWADGERVKLAAAWLVEQAGGKAMREGAARVHERQALVLVNDGDATATEVLELARRIAAAVAARFGVELRIEPAIYG